MKIAILDDYQGVALKLVDWSTLPGDLKIVAFSEHWKDPKEISEKLKDFEIVVVMRERTPFPKELLEVLPHLKLLATTGMRNASIDLKAASNLGIVVSGTRSGGPSTAELAWGIILSLLRHIPQEYSSVQQGGWQTTIGTDLKGKTLGLLGLGNLGTRMATVGLAFGMTVIAWSQNLTDEKAREHGAVRVSKDELFHRSDVISIHLQLSDRTRGLVGERELSMMKPAAFLINTSRGPIVDEKALVAALTKHRIAGAGVDVFDEEPLPPGHPFRKLENLIVTPHLGYVTRETYKIFYSDAVEDILAFRKGQPIRVLNPSPPENQGGRI